MLQLSFFRPTRFINFLVHSWCSASDSFVVYIFFFTIIVMDKVVLKYYVCARVNFICLTGRFNIIKTPTAASTEVGTPLNILTPMTDRMCKPIHAIYITLFCSAPSLYASTTPVVRQTEDVCKNVSLFHCRLPSRYYAHRKLSRETS